MIRVKQMIIGGKVWFSWKFFCIYPIPLSQSGSVFQRIPSGLNSVFRLQDMLPNQGQKTQTVLLFTCSTVIYYPSTELSIKRCNCVNKPKKSGSRWTIRKNIDRVPAAARQLRQECQSENKLTKGWALSDPRLSNPSQDVIEMLLWSREELGSI